MSHAADKGDNVLSTSATQTTDGRLSLSGQSRADINTAFAAHSAGKGFAETGLPSLTIDGAPPAGGQQWTETLNKPILAPKAEHRPVVEPNIPVPPTVEPNIPVPPTVNPNMPVPTFEHPHQRIDQVNEGARDLHQALTKDLGHLSGNHNNLEQQVDMIKDQEKQFAKIDNGHLTSAEQSQLDAEEKSVKAQIKAEDHGAKNSQYNDNHPLRSQIEIADRNMNNEIVQDSSKLGAANFQKLSETSLDIMQKEKADAKANGGHLTPEELKQLGGQEALLKAQINADLKPKPST